MADKIHPPQSTNFIFLPYALAGSARGGYLGGGLTFGAGIPLREASRLELGVGMEWTGGLGNDQVFFQGRNIDTSDYEQSMGFLSRIAWTAFPTKRFGVGFSGHLGWGGLSEKREIISGTQIQEYERNGNGFIFQGLANATVGFNETFWLHGGFGVRSMPALDSRENRSYGLASQLGVAMVF